MNTKTFNENFTIDRKSKGVKAMPKHAPVAAEIMTADGTAYDPAATYHFFDVQTQEVRQSLGLRRDGEYLCAFGLKVVLIAKLRASRDDALSDGQTFFKSEIERLQERVAEFELEKTNDSRSLKAFLMAKE
jgi:hypothetical protein